MKLKTTVKLKALHDVLSNSLQSCGIAGLEPMSTPKHLPATVVLVVAALSFDKLGNVLSMKIQSFVSVKYNTGNYEVSLKYK